MNIRWIRIKNETEFQEIETMKKRIWNQLKKAAVLAALAGIVGNCVASASEFSAQEEQKVLLKQSAQWTDEKNFQAEVCLELSGLKELYAEITKSGNIISEQQNAQIGQNEQAVETEQLDEDGYMNEKVQAEEEMQLEENVPSGDEDVYDEDTHEEDVYGEEDIYLEENDQVGENGQAEEHKQPEEEGRGTSDGQNPESSQQASDVRYFLTAYISEYFQVDETGLKYDMQAESVKIQNQKGQETEITKLTCEVPVKDAQADTFSLKIPVSLREEYRISPVSVSYPVCQDKLSLKEQTQETSGAYFWKKAEDNAQVLAVSDAASLQVAEAKAGIEAKLQPEVDKTRSGQKISYVLTVSNTGELSLENIEVRSSFSMENIKASWEQIDGFVADSAQGVITALQPGETKKLRMNLQLTENQSGELIHAVTLKTGYPGKDEEISCQTDAQVTVEELKAAFEVEKTADRTQAYPGDTITYQICIRNTGERTLHSVLSTERFQNAGILAKFVQKEGVTLSNNGTQALIPQIAPGEAFALYATVTIPQYFTSQELVNEVTVISDETGSRIMKSQSNVTLTTNTNTATVTPEPTPVTVQTYSDGYGYASKSAGAYSAASKPKTGDETEIALYIVLGIFAVMSGISAFYYLRSQKRH